MPRSKPRKRTTPAQAKAYVVRQLTEAYGSSVFAELADHIDGGGDVYASLTWT